MNRFQSIFWFLYHPRWHWLFPTVLCALWAAFCVPTLAYNLDDVRMIAYFNGDEIYLLDTMWFIYSGQFNPETIQGLRDYGLLLSYIADIFHLFVAPFIDVTPGMLWIVVRSLHLICGLLALLALWRLAVRHFGYGWVPVVSVLGLGLCPAFISHIDFCKQEPITILLVVIGLDHILRIVETGSSRSVFIASFCAVAAFVVKYIGVFLIPIIIASVVANWWLQPKRYDKANWLPAWKRSEQLTPYLGFVVGGVLLAGTYWGLFGYVWKTQGGTLVEMFGFVAALTKPVPVAGMPVIPALMGCALLVITGGWIVVWRKVDIEQSVAIAKSAVVLMRVYAATVLVLCYCGALFAIIGFRWFIAPQDLIALFSEVSGVSLWGLAGGEISTYIAVVIANLREFLYTASGLRTSFLPRFDSLLFSNVFSFPGLALLAIYIIVEIKVTRQVKSALDIAAFKRLHLGLFLLVYAGYVIMTSSRSSRAEIHLMILVVPGFLLIGQIHHLVTGYKYRAVLAVASIFLLASTWSLNSYTSVRWRIERFEQGEGSADSVWEIQQWWRDHVPANAAIVCDLPYRIYLPPEYDNVSFFNALLHDGVDFSQVRQSIKEKFTQRSPQFFYFNNDENYPSVEQLVPEYEMELVATFHGTSRPRDRYYIYEVIGARAALRTDVDELDTSTTP